MTLDPGADAEALLADPPSGATTAWGLKDSFAALYLASEGFVPAFDANWIARTEVPRSASAATRVATREDLDYWISGWGETPQGAAIFLPTLLERRVSFYALEAQGQVTAEIAALVDVEVAGYSNAFGPARGIAACLAALDADAGGRPLVGYERGAALAMMTTLGFHSVGPLRVWTCAPAVRPA